MNNLASTRIFGHVTPLVAIANMHGSIAKYVGAVKFRKRRGQPHKCDTAGMTALVSQYTPEGFVIGADSLRLDLHGEVVTESAVKLYPTQHPSFPGAYGFAGHTALEYTDGRPMLNVLHIASDVADDLAKVPLSSPQEYVENFCRELADRIAVASIGVALPNEPVFTRVMFVGYYQHRPVRLQAIFPAINGSLQRPRLTEWVEAPNPFCMASGSQVVWDELSQDAYQPETLEEAIEFVRTYLARCIENSADPYCSSIGGRPQIATVTPNGFSWVARPDSKTPEQSQAHIS